MYKRIFSLLLIVLLMAFSLVACGDSTENADGTPDNGDNEPTVEAMDLVYITNPVGSGYYSVAAGQGALLSTNTPLNVIVTPSTGPEGIVASMKSGEAQLGINCPNHFFTYWDDSQGDYNLSSLRSIQAGNTLCFSFIVNADSGINSVPDLAGKRVTFDGLSDTHKQMSEAILKAYGIDPQTGIQRMKMSFSTSGLTELAEGRTDAVIASIAGSKLEELASKITPVVLPVEHEQALKVSEMYPALVPAKLFKSVPGGVAGMDIVGMATVMYCMDDLSEDVVYLVTKNLVENYKKLAPICEELEQWSPERAVSKDSVFPYHEGAIKYYKEAGLWTDEMDEWNESKIAEYANM